mmetsp:Transcript_68939/g.194437  ORF Transcript_68939/g.194437 Transcript_68939/m.194437 type:complete len:233 (+) Transcript_68939:144-842(+)
MDGGDEGDGGPRSQIIYALVLRGPKMVLAEHTRFAGNFEHATIPMLAKFDRDVEMNSYIYGEYAFHYVIDDGTGLWFVCMADRTTGRRLPIAFLGAVQQKFKARYSHDEVQSAIAYGMQHEFKGEIRALMEQYNSPNADKLTYLTEMVNKIKDDAMESIDKIIERQDRIELLVTRTMSLSDSSGSFRRGAEGLRNTMWWRNVRTLLKVGGVAVLVILIIMLFACGPTLQHCR